MSDKLKEFLEAYAAWYAANVKTDDGAQPEIGGSTPPPPPPTHF